MFLTLPVSATTVTKLFQVHGVCAVSIDINSDDFDGATIGLLYDPQGLGVYHAWSPPTTSLMLDGNAFVVSETWSGVLPLAPGHYGIEQSAPPIDPVKLHISGELVGPDTNTSTYGG